MGWRHVSVAQPQGQHSGQQQQAQAHAIDRAGAGHKHQTAQGRTADDRHLGAGRIEGGGPRQQGRRHKQRSQGLLGRHLKSTRQPQHHRQAQEQITPEPTASLRPAGSGRQQHQRHHGLSDQTSGDDATAVHAIGRMPGHQREHQGRNKLVEPHQAQVPGAVGKLVHLPADSHHQHLLGRGAGQPRTPHAHVVAQPKQIAQTRIGRHGEPL